MWEPDLPSVIHSKTIDIIASVLRLSTKYEVEYLRRYWLVQLDSCFPTKLAKWRTIYSDPTLAAITDPLTLSTLKKAFALSREFHLDWIVPSIIVGLSAYEVDSFLTDSIPLSIEDERLYLVALLKLSPQRASFILGINRIICETSATVRRLHFKRSSLFHFVHSRHEPVYSVSLMNFVTKGQ
jgi:hypothetical protein